MGMRVHVRAVRSADLPRLQANGLDLASPLRNHVPSVHLEKAWHGLHYLLTGSAGEGGLPLGFLLEGGREIGEDLGYGPARYFEADQVADIARELSRPNLEAEMMARWDPDQMATLGIYPAVFEPDDDEWLMSAFRKLRQFYVDASAANLAVVTCIE